MKSVYFFLIVLIAASAYGQPKPASQDQKMNTFITSLLNKMTLDEKIGQLNLVSIGFDVTGPIVSKNVDENIKKGLVGGVFNTYTPVAVRKLQDIAVKQTRLKIPLIFGYDVIHGHRTIFPVNLGMSASWDLAAIERSARIAAEEATADGLHWTFSPMVDIARDPRWGRVSEGSGEDSWLGSRIAEAMVKGYQGRDLTAYNSLLACVKHFALYGAAEAGRDYNTVDMSERRMMDEYMPPYKSAVKAGAGSVMTSFNEINGVPATGNKWLMNDLLRKQWGFNGLIVTDYTAINEMTPHGMGDDAKTGELAIKAGIDMDMVGEIYLSQLKKLVNEGRVSITLINAACRRVLETKYRLGLFSDPYRHISEERAAQTLMKDEFRAAARDMARKSMVLLKNSNKTLPLKKSETIALIGPLARNQRDMIGSWSGAGDWKLAVSVEAGLKNAAGNSARILYAKGANFTDDTLLIRRLNEHGGELDIDRRTSEEMIQEAVETARGADVIVAVVGESQGMSGEAASRADIGLPDKQPDLLEALRKTGKPLVIVLMNGRPLTLTREDKTADAILETWFAGTEAGNAIADMLFGDYNPSGKLTMTFPRMVGQVPLYYNHKNTGRPFGTDQLDKYKSRYLDVPNDPLYPFGYGLSYTTFSYSKPVLSSGSLQPGGTITVSVEVKNTGEYDGEEVVQLYIQDLSGSVTRPVKELRNFKKIMLKKGESLVISFTISESDIRFHDINMNYVAEPGQFKVYTGGNSRDVQEAVFTLLQKRTAR